MQILACLKTFILALSSLCKASILATLSPLWKNKKVTLLAALLPLWKEKAINLCLFSACLVKNIQHCARETKSTAIYN